MRSARSAAAATLLPLDLAEGGQIDAIGPSIHQRFGRLDVLVHNAGALGRLTPVAHILPDDWADAMAVNLTRRMAPDPHLRPAVAQCRGRPRGVRHRRNVRVRRRRIGAPTGQTKAGMEHLVLTWADEVRTTRLRVNLFDPGVVATRLRGQAMPGEDPSTLATPDDVAPALVTLCLPDEQRHGVTIGVRHRHC